MPQTRILPGVGTKPTEVGPTWHHMMVTRTKNRSVIRVFLLISTPYMVIEQCWRKFPPTTMRTRATAVQMTAPLRVRSHGFILVLPSFLRLQDDWEINNRPVESVKHLDLVKTDYIVSLFEDPDPDFLYFGGTVPTGVKPEGVIPRKILDLPSVKVFDPDLIL